MAAPSCHEKGEIKSPTAKFFDPDFTEGRRGRMVADGFLQEVTERTETYQRADPFGLFTEGNEGNEDPLPAHIARFVLLVIFCSNL
jgi:hypothetical protein